MKPCRIQLRRVKGWRMPAGAINCARPGKYGNRYIILRTIEHVDGKPVLVRDAAHAKSLHREWLDWQMSQLSTMREGLRHDLGGRDLACWCKLDQPCHADNYLDVANA